MTRELFPEELDFIRLHVGQDMSPRSVAAFLGVTAAKVYEAAHALKLPNVDVRLCRICTPYPIRIASAVRKATIEDAYWPMSLAEFQRRFRPEGWTR